ncbi:hypothetical protein J3459_013641 [Metarhizium acridum]|nr:hypothetical protein J3459_013641 [Metarhizium acridum]
MLDGWLHKTVRTMRARHIYIRASIFVPISRPGIRMQWAYFEESCGRIDVAADIHAAILMKLPDCVEVVVSWPICNVVKMDLMLLFRLVWRQSCFWEKWFEFELDQSATGDEENETAERIKSVFDEFRTKSRLSGSVKRELARVYMNYLVQRGGKDAMTVFLEVDREMFGPAAISSKSAITSKENGNRWRRVGRSKQTKGRSEAACVL